MSVGGDTQVCVSTWLVMERMQGEIAREIRNLLGEEAYDQGIFTDAERARRVEAMKQCAASNVSDKKRHEAWCQMHTDGGWVYGEKFDPVAKTHPNVLPWDQLPASARVKANIFAIVAKAAKQIDDAARSGDLCGCDS